MKHPVYVDVQFQVKPLSTCTSSSQTKNSFDRKCLYARGSKMTKKWNIGQLTVLILVLYDWLHPSAGICTKLKLCHIY